MASVLGHAAALPAVAQDGRQGGLLENAQGAFSPKLAQASDFYQRWIHANAKECCPHDRCFPVIAVPGRRYWSVMGFRSAVPLGGERRWPFATTYGCAYAGSPDTIRCLFAPVPEAS